MTPEPLGAREAVSHALLDGEPPRLEFSVDAAGVVEYAAAPMLRFALRIDAGAAAIRSLSLHAQIRIVAPARGYDRTEETRLYELFGAPRDWARNLRTLLWTETTFVVPAFDGDVTTELRVPCSYDFDVAANKYLYALRDGAIPLEFLFSGSVFYNGPTGALRTVRLPWDRECRFEMSGRLWHEMMERYFRNTAWLRVRRDVFDQLLAFRSEHGLPTWESTLEALLADPPRDGERERPS